MKAFLALLLSAASVMAQFGDDNPSGKWLPLPDDFKWPLPEEPSPEFKPEWKILKDLPPAQREAILRHWPDDKNPERIQVAEVDLNNDARPELFVGIPGYSGSGGTFYEILSRTRRENYTSIGHLQGWLRFLVRKNGYYQIEGASSGGGGNYTRYLMAFDPDGYVITRSEGHDFNCGNVMVRKIPDVK